jgi:hypothetical protein
MTDLDRRAVLTAAAALACGHAGSSHAEAVPADLADSLIAAGPHPSLGHHAETYGRFVGRWRGEYKLFRSEGIKSGPIGVTFGWILGGRAIQDSGWVLEALRPNTDGPGSTLRIYDSAIQAWRIVFVDPVHRVRTEMVGRRVGDDVIQQGYYRDRAVKWIFTEVTLDSFVWRGYHLADDGEKWVLEDEYRFRRVVA